MVLAVCGRKVHPQGAFDLRVLIYTIIGINYCIMAFGTAFADMRLGEDAKAGSVRLVPGWAGGREKSDGIKHCGKAVCITEDYIL